MVEATIRGHGDLERAGIRAPAMARTRAGLATWLAMLDDWARVLAPLADELPEAGLGRGLDSSALMRHLVTDWGGRPAAEATATAISSAIRRRMRPVDRGTAIVLGAGAGRVAWDLRDDFDHVVSLDLEVGFGLAHAALGQGDVRLCDPLEANAHRIEDLCPVFTLRRPTAANVTACVADALALPFARGSATTIIACFFSDIVGLPRLFEAIAPVLAPGGSFIHFGPLGYLQYEPGVMWTAEEVRAELPRAGYQLRDEEWVEHPIWPNDSMVGYRSRSWCFGATRRSPLTPAASPPASP